MFTLFKIIAVLLDILALFKIYKDERYLFDGEKTRYYAITLLIPFAGAIYSLSKIGFNWLSIFAPLKMLNCMKRRPYNHTEEFYQCCFEDEK